MPARVIRFFAITLTAAAVMTGGAAMAQDATKRLAFSKKMGVEVQAVLDAQGQWCAPKVDLRLIATTAEFFTGGTATTLVKQLGKILPKDCPQVAEFAIAGKQAGAQETIYWGKASAADGWALAATDAPPQVAEAAPARPAPEPEPPQAAASQPTDAPASATTAPADTTPLAQRALIDLYDAAPTRTDFGPGGAFNLIGDWRGTYTCKNWRSVIEYSYTLSIHHQDGESYKALIAWQGGKEEGVSIGAGHYLLAHNQISFRATETVRGNGWGDDVGQFDKEKQAFVMKAARDCTPAIVKRIDDTPRTAIDFFRALEFANKAKDWAEARLVRGSTVGRMPKGTFTLQSCDQLAQWAQSYPLDRRLALDVNSNNQMLLHYQDEPSARYFGSPAYYWTDDDFAALRNLRRKCFSGQMADLVSAVVRDRPSIRVLNTRRSLDHMIVATPVGVVVNGYSADRLYRHFDNMVGARDKEIGKQLGYDFERAAVVSDYALARAEFGLYRDLFAELTIRAKVAAPLPAGDRLIAEAQDRIAAINGISGTPTLDGAKGEAVQALQAKAQAALEPELSAMSQRAAQPVASFDDISSVKKDLETLRAKAGGLVPEERFAEIEGVLNASVRAGGDKILAAERAKLESMVSDEAIAKMAAPKDLRDVFDQMAEVDKTFADAGLDAERAKYAQETKAAKTKLADAVFTLDEERKQAGREAMGRVFDQLRSRGDLLPVSDADQDQVTQVVNVVFQSFQEDGTRMEKMFGDYPVRDRVELWVSERQRLFGEIYYDFIADVARAYFMVDDQSTPDDILPPDRYPYLLNSIKKPFVFLAKKELAWANEKQMKLAEDLVSEVIDTQEERSAGEIETLLRQTGSATGEAALKEAFADWSYAKSMSRALTKLAANDDRFETLGDQWSEAANDLGASVCRTEYELGSDDASLPVLAGTGTIDLGTLNCAMKVAGLELMEYGAPGLFGDDNYTLKYMGPRGYETFKMKEIEIGPDRTALVGVSQSDGVKETGFGRDEWATSALGLLISAEQQTQADFGSRQVADENTRKSLQFLDGLQQMFQR